MRSIPSVMLLCIFILSNKQKAVAEYFTQDDRKSTNANCPSDPQTIIAGYLPDYRGYIDVNAAAMHLTDLILFSIQPNIDGSISGTCCLSSSHYKKARAAKLYKQKAFENTGSVDRNTCTNNQAPLRIFVSVGGAGRSMSFSAISSDARKRKKLIDELKLLCETEMLSGVNFDWEQPQTQTQYRNYLILIKEAYEVFHDHNLLVTVALHSNQILPQQFYDYLDHVYVMTYDMLPPKGEKFYHHAPYDAVINALEAFVERGGCPKSKLVLGIPAYGRNRKNPNQVKTYSEIIDDYNKEKSSYGGETDSSLYSKKKTIKDLDFSQGYAFDSPSSVADKVFFAQTNGFGGVFFWELGQDKQDKTHPGGILLEAATSNTL